MHFNTACRKITFFYKAYHNFSEYIKVPIETFQTFELFAIKNVQFVV